MHIPVSCDIPVMDLVAKACVPVEDPTHDVQCMHYVLVVDPGLNINHYVPVMDPSFS